LHGGLFVGILEHPHGDDQVEIDIVDFDQVRQLRAFLRVDDLRKRDGPVAKRADVVKDGGAPHFGCSDEVSRAQPSHSEPGYPGLVGGHAVAVGVPIIGPWRCVDVRDDEAIDFVDLIVVPSAGLEVEAIMPCLQCRLISAFLPPELGLCHPGMDCRQI